MKKQKKNILTARLWVLSGISRCGPAVGGGSAGASPLVPISRVGSNLKTSARAVSSTFLTVSAFRSILSHHNGHL